MVAQVQEAPRDAEVPVHLDEVRSKDTLPVRSQSTQWCPVSHVRPGLGVRNSDDDLVFPHLSISFLPSQVRVVWSQIGPSSWKVPRGAGLCRSEYGH